MPQLNQPQLLKPRIIARHRLQHRHLSRVHMRKRSGARSPTCSCSAHSRLELRQARSRNHARRRNPVKPARASVRRIVPTSARRDRTGRSALARARRDRIVAIAIARRARIGRSALARAALAHGPQQHLALHAPHQRAPVAVQLPQAANPGGKRTNRHA